MLQERLDSDILLGEFERDQIMSRMGKLRGGLTIIRAGGISEVEIKESRDRVQDALLAVKAALEQGFVIGGGFALV